MSKDFCGARKIHRKNSPQKLTQYRKSRQNKAKEYPETKKNTPQFICNNFSYE